MSQIASMNKLILFEHFFVAVSYQPGKMKYFYISGLSDGEGCCF